MATSQPRRSGPKAPMNGFLVVGIIVVFIRCQLAGCTPIPIIPPGCHDLCVKLGGTFLDCIKQCPPIEQCEKAMTMVNLTETYMGGGPIQRPQLCKPHCWEANIYTERRCMLDCPLTWCVQYGGMTTTTAPPTTTTTMVTTTRTASSTTSTTKNPTLGNALGQRSSGTHAPPVPGESTGNDETGPSGHSLVAIILGSLSSVSILAVLIVVTVRCGYKKIGDLVAKASLPPKHENILMSPLPETNRDEGGELVAS